MTEIIQMTDCININAARAEFEKNVGADVYEDDFSAIGQGFKLMSMIGKSTYVYVKAVKEGKAVGLAYGHPEGEAGFYIQDIISAPGSHSGSAMVDWFANTTNVGIARLRKLSLAAANEGLQTVYAKAHYGFLLTNKSIGRMERDLAPA